MPFITSQTRGFQSQSKQQRQLFGSGLLESSVGQSHNPQNTQVSSPHLIPPGYKQPGAGSGQPTPPPGYTQPTRPPGAQPGAGYTQPVTGYGQSVGVGQPVFETSLPNETIYYKPSIESRPTAVGIMDTYLNTGFIRDSSKSRSCKCDRPPKKDIKYIECNPCPCKK